MAGTDVCHLLEFSLSHSETLRADVLDRRSRRPLGAAVCHTFACLLHCTTFEALPELKGDTPSGQGEGSLPRSPGRLR